jgi:hypothetical protein
LFCGIEKKARLGYEHKAHSAHPDTRENSMSDEKPAPEQGEAPMGAPRQVHTTFTLPHIIRVVTVNVLVLTELCIAMYMASQNPEEFTAVFFKVFFALLVPTLILSSVSKRFMRPKAQP